MVEKKTKLKQELEDSNLIIRHEYPQVPLKVEYFLSERGKSFPFLSEQSKIKALRN